MTNLIMALVKPVEKHDWVSHVAKAHWRLSRVSLRTSSCLFQRFQHTIRRTSTIIVALRIIDVGRPFFGWPPWNFTREPKRREKEEEKEEWDREEIGGLERLCMESRGDIVEIAINQTLYSDPPWQEKRQRAKARKSRDKKRHALLWR